MDADRRRSLHEWFLLQLAEAWDTGSTGSGNIDDDRYVQWAGSDLGLQIECASNHFLTGASRLTAAQMEHLRRWGWNDPLGDDLPNHWRVFVDRADLPEAAAALVDVVALLRDESPEPVHNAGGGTEVALSAADGPSRRRPRQTSARPRTRTAVPEERAVDTPCYIASGTECRSKAEFTDLLSRWLEHPARDGVIGEPSSYGGKPLVRVRIADRLFHLNGDTRAAGVEEYLHLVAEHGDDLRWHVVANAVGRVNKVAFGEPPSPVSYFYLYATEPSPRPYTI